MLRKSQENNTLDISALSANKRMDRPEYQDSAPNLTQYRSIRKLGKSREKPQNEKLCKKTAEFLDFGLRRTVFQTTLMSG